MAIDTPATSGLECCFEKESELEEAERKTNFDFFVLLPKEKKVFFEIKYTEYGFGKAKKDKEHRDKFKKTYLPLLRVSDCLEKQCHDENFFLKHYQMLRNLVHLSSASNLVLLFPSANQKIRDQAEEAKNNFLNDLGRSRFKVVYLEELISDMKKSCFNTALASYWSKFEGKYLLPEWRR